jgi:predicted amidophosphoribosyltransferase
MRIRETQSQVELSLPERKNNMKGAFKALHHHVQGKNIIVIDDVTTSDSTLEACASALLEAGATAVYGLTVARAILSMA